MENTKQTIQIRRDYKDSMEYDIPLHDGSYLSVKDYLGKRIETRNNEDIENEEFNTWILLYGKWYRAMSIDFE